MADRSGAHDPPGGDDGPDARRTGAGGHNRNCGKDSDMPRLQNQGNKKRDTRGKNVQNHKVGRLVLHSASLQVLVLEENKDTNHEYNGKADPREEIAGHHSAADHQEDQQPNDEWEAQENHNDNQDNLAR